MQQRRDVLRIVLAVTVEPHDAIVALIERKPVAHLHGAAKAEVMGQLQEFGSGFDSGRGRVVRRAIVDNNNQRIRHDAAHRLDNRADRGLLVVRRDENHQ